MTQRSVNIHATCIVLADAARAFHAPAALGVLLLGASGAGKSDLALRLIERGAKLVADDRCELFVADGRLRARAPAALAGLIELHGVGLVALPFAEDAPIGLAVRLAVGENPVRLPERQYWDPPDELRPPRAARPPLISLSAFAASAPAKVVAASAAFAQALFREQINPI